MCVCIILFNIVRNKKEKKKMISGYHSVPGFHTYVRIFHYMDLSLFMFDIYVHCDLCMINKMFVIVSSLVFLLPFFNINQNSLHIAIHLHNNKMYFDISEHYTENTNIIFMITTKGTNRSGINGIC